MIMKCANSFNSLHHSKRIFQLYCVDMWAKIETDALEYLHFNQENLHTELYSSLQDALHVGCPCWELRGSACHFHWWYTIYG